VIGEIELDPAARTVQKADSALRLTPKEFDLLHYLMRHAGQPVSHAQLLRAVWGADYGGELEYLRTFMHQLRRKIESDPSAPEYLLTELHFGYRFRQAA
jgi:two-component system KDP operon response regulator KdpE